MEASHNGELPSLKELIAEGVEAAWQHHGYITGEGERDTSALEDKLFARISKAIVKKRADRAATAITRRELMAEAFPHVPGPEAWAEQDDPEIAEGVYRQLDGYIRRLAGPNANDRIQHRLNGDTGLALCWTTATRSEVAAVYVTSDLECLREDYTKPHKDRILKETARLAMNLAMLVERQPELAKSFKRELTGGVKAALGAGAAILDPAIEAVRDDE